MTSDAHRKKIRRLAKENGLDPTAALRYASAAETLSDSLLEGDTVLWPLQNGGLAWTALDTGKQPVRSHHGYTDSASRVLCIRPEYSGCTPSLWKAMNDFSVKQGGAEIMPVLLSENAGSFTEETKGPQPSAESLRSLPEKKDTMTQPAKGLKALFLGLSEYFRGLAGVPSADLSPMNSSGTDSGTVQESGPVAGQKKPSASDSIIIAEDGCKRLLIGSDVLNDSVNSLNSPSRQSSVFSPVPGLDRVCRLSTKLSLGERTAAFESLKFAGMVPILDIDSNESFAVASYVANLFDKSGSGVIAVTGEWKALAPFRAIENLPVLSPASQDDEIGALTWASGNTGTSVIHLPGNGYTMDKAAALRSDWKTGEGVVIRDGSKGSAGKVLFIVPGSLAGEARKAADKLARENHSARVVSARFPSIVVAEQLESFAEDCDLTVLAETGEFPGDLRSTYGAILRNIGLENLVLAESPVDAKALADLAIATHKENRLKKAVDDVKADRWR